MTTQNHRVRFGPAEWVAVAGVIVSVFVSAGSVGWGLSSDLAAVKSKIDATEATLRQIEATAERKAEDISKLQQDVAALKARAGLFGEQGQHN